MEVVLFVQTSVLPVTQTKLSLNMKRTSHYCKEICELIGYWELAVNS